MWSSGWGADFFNVQSGLVHAMSLSIPLIMSVDHHPWHYTANKNDMSNMTCSAADTTCYFLPYHGCSGTLTELRSNKEVEIVEDDDLPDEGNIRHWIGQYAYHYMTRRQLWLRRAVYDYKQHFRQSNDIKATSDCYARSSFGRRFT